MIVEVKKDYGRGEYWVNDKSKRYRSEDIQNPW